MSIEALGWVKNQTCPTPTSKLVLFVLANYADEKHSCYPSEKHLAQICQINDRSIRRNLTLLQDAGLLTIKHRLGTSNRYYLKVPQGVVTDNRRGVVTDNRRVRSLVTANTKEILKTKTGKNKNELAG